MTCARFFAPHGRLALALLLLVALALRASGEFVEEFSLQPPFVRGHSTVIENWEYGGSAVATDSFLRLVPSIRSRHGYVWAEKPCEFPDWQVVVEFAIHNVRSPGADGMAFWYTRDRMNGGPVYGNQQDFVGLGIVFDTFDNDGSRDGPTVLAIHSTDGSLVYDHQTDGTLASITRSQKRFRNTAEPVKALIRYRGGTLRVSIDVDGSGNYDDCFEVNGLDLPVGYYFGVTAATGGFADYHDLYSLRVENLSPKERATQALSGDDGVDNDKPFDFDEYKLSFLRRLQRLSQERAGKDSGPLKSDGVVKRDVPADPPAEPPAEAPPVVTAVTPPPTASSAVAVTGDMGDVVEMLDRMQQADASLAAAIARSERSLGAVADSVRSSGVEMGGVARKLNDVARSVENMHGETSSYMEVVDALSRKLSSLHVEVAKLERVVESLHGEVKNMRDYHGESLRDVQDRIHTFGSDIRKDARFGFWSYFFLFQAVFGVALYWFWKKYRDDKKWL